MLVGTDHPNGDNYIGMFQDTGNAGPVTIQRVFEVEDRPDAPKYQPYCTFIERAGTRLVAGFKGFTGSLLAVSDDGLGWTIEPPPPPPTHVRVPDLIRKSVAEGGGREAMEFQAQTSPSNRMSYFSASRSRHLPWIVVGNNPSLVIGYLEESHVGD